MDDKMANTKQIPIMSFNRDSLVHEVLIAEFTKENSDLDLLNIEVNAIHRTAKKMLSKTDVRSVNVVISEFDQLELIPSNIDKSHSTIYKSLRRHVKIDG